MHRISRLWAGLLLIGVIVAAFWIITSGQADLARGLERLRIAYVPLLFAATSVFLAVRFVRWQYLLRSAGVRIPTRPSLTSYLASLVGIATPAYVGECIRGAFIRRKFGVPLRISVWIIFVERLLDVLTLSLIGLVFVDPAWMRVGLAALALASVAVGLAGSTVVSRWGVPVGAASVTRARSTMAAALTLSFCAWLPAVLLVSVAAHAMSVVVPAGIGMGIFSSSTLFGGMTLAPAGVGAAGSAMILQLESVGLSVADGTLVVTLIRLASVGFAVIIGLFFLAYELAVLRRPSVNDGALHFNEIAIEYRAQFSEHVWDHLLRRKIDLIQGALPKEASYGLDLGCGLGEQCLAMQERGHSVTGLDASEGLVRLARKRGIDAVVGDACALPFADNTFDFVYTIGVLHHLPDAEAQRKATAEVLRVLKPGGLFLIHETNPRNVLFRFYMGYVFPILRSIDEGTEHWIDPDRWNRTAHAQLQHVTYFTFMPDFVPQRLLRFFLSFQNRLERSHLRSYSVHYMAAIEKVPDPFLARRSTGSEISAPA